MQCWKTHPPLPVLCPNTFLACSWTSSCGFRCLSLGAISTRPGALCPQAADGCEVQHSLLSNGLHSGSGQRRQSSSADLWTPVHRGTSSRGFRGSCMPAHTCPWPWPWRWPWPHRWPDVQRRRRSISHTLHTTRFPNMSKQTSVIKKREDSQRSNPLHPHDSNLTAIFACFMGCFYPNFN